MAPSQHISPRHPFDSELAVPPVRQLRERHRRAWRWPRNPTTNEQGCSTPAVFPEGSGRGASLHPREATPAVTTATHNSTGIYTTAAGYLGAPVPTQARTMRTMRTANDHLCPTFALVQGGGGAYTCEHNHTVSSHDVTDAVARANLPADVAADTRPAASGQSASEQPVLVVGRKPVHQGDEGCSEAVLAACALAQEGNAIAGRDVTHEQAQRMVTRALAHFSEYRVLGWRQFTFDRLWDQQWRWAVSTLRRLFPATPGIGELTEDHAEAGLPAIAAAHC